MRIEYAHTWVKKYDPKIIVTVLSQLGFSVRPAEISQAAVGSVNATYLTPDLAIKLNQNRAHPSYLANKIISDKLAKKYPVVEVLCYDYFNITDFEVLVMKRSPGSALVDNIFELNKKQLLGLFDQTLSIVKKLHSFEYSNFGLVNLKDNFPTYTAYLQADFSKHIDKIKKENIIAPEDIKKIEEYFFKNIGIFNDTKAVFVHTDLHMGNILHENGRLTALIDFDSAQKAPAVRSLLSLLGFVDYPQQFVEGTKYFKVYQNKHFRYLLPLLKDKFSEIFEDSGLVMKLNLIGLNELVMYISHNWSAKWNAQMLEYALTYELPTTKNKLSMSYFGRILKGPY